MTWRPAAAATLAAWVDDDEYVWPKSRSVYAGRGSIDFDYPTNDAGGYHEFEWTLLFPEQELRRLRVEVSWDGSTWHTVGSRKKPIKHTWSSFGVAP
ncbi:MAG: hypothetical protein ACE37F_05020 [Nannocystaceae bacterium]|nr:hypothetical protein [bacterium]